MKYILKLTASILLIAALLGGCSSSPVSHREAVDDTLQDAADDANQEEVDGSLSSDQLVSDQERQELGPDQIDESINEDREPIEDDSSQNDYQADEPGTDAGDTREKPKISESKQVLGFYTNDEGYLPGSYDTLMQQAEQIDFVAPFWFRLDAKKGSGHIEHHVDDGFTKLEMKKVIGDAQSKGVKVLALIHNLLYGNSSINRRVAHEMISTQVGRQNFYADLESILSEYGFDGINMDVEHFPNEDKEVFSEFMHELYDRLSKQGYLVTISVPSKTGDSRSNVWAEPFDYEALGKAADLVLLMTYDEHGYISEPGPIASPEWIEDVLAYAVKRIPANKILMGVPSYGFDWTVGQKGPKYISYQLASDIAKENSVEIGWDENYKVPYFEYVDDNGQHHEVWFENAASWQAKLQLIDKWGIKGIGIWRIGMEDPAGWTVIKDSPQFR